MRLYICVLALICVSEGVKISDGTNLYTGYNGINLGGPIQLGKNLGVSLNGISSSLNNVNIVSADLGKSSVPLQSYGYKLSVPQSATQAVSLDLTKNLYGKLDTSAFQLLKYETPAVPLKTSSNLDLSSYQIQSGNLGGGNLLQSIPIQQGKISVPSIQSLKYTMTLNGGNAFGSKYDLSGLGKLSSISSLASTSSLGSQFDLSSLKYGALLGNSFTGHLGTSPFGNSFVSSYGSYGSNPSVSHVDAKELGFSNDGKFDVSTFNNVQNGQVEASDFHGYRPPTESYQNYQPAPVIEQKVPSTIYDGGNSQDPTQQPNFSTQYGAGAYSPVGGNVQDSYSIPPSGGDSQYSTIQQPIATGSLTQQSGAFKQISAPDLSQYPNTPPLPSATSLQPQITPSQQSVSIGSGSLGVTKLSNGNYALGSGSLGYAAAPPTYTKGVPLGTLSSTQSTLNQPQQSIAYDSTFLKGI